MKRRRKSALRRRYGRSGGFADARFVMDRAKSSRGEWGWALAELFDEHGRRIPGGRFVFWSPSSVEVRQHAHRLGATVDNLFIDGRPARDYRMAEGVGARVRRAR
jgi:hypothetical protein